MNFGLLPLPVPPPLLWANYWAKFSMLVKEVLHYNTPFPVPQLICMHITKTNILTNGMVGS